MKKLDEFKHDYENITASEELKQKIQSIIQEDKKMSKHKYSFKKYAAVAAGVAVIFTASVNISPSIAYAMNDVPVLNSIVKVLTFDRYEVKEDNYSANIATPEIKGLLDKDLENKINQEFKDNSNALISAFEKDIEDLKAEFGEDGFHMGIDSDYIVKTDNDHILAIDAYIVNTVGSSSTVHNYYTIDKKTGTLLTLEGFFKEGSDYVSVISDYIKDEIVRLNKDEGGMFFDDENFDGFQQIKADNKFYINNDGDIVICFDKYEIAAGAQGSPEFVLPDELVEGILK